VGFDDADAFGKIQHRFGESLVLLLAVRDFLRASFRNQLPKVMKGILVCMGVMEVECF
jgi:hypothetical protein